MKKYPLTEEFLTKFLTNTDETGRFIVTSKRTGVKYFVEPIEPRNMKDSKWGDINPATGQLEGSYGDKYKGSINKEESIISIENGFDKVHTTNVGDSPFGYIEMLDKKYPTKE